MYINLIELKTDRIINFQSWILPGTYEVEVTGRVMIREISSKFRDAGFIVMTVLRVKFHITVYMQKHQLDARKDTVTYMIVSHMIPHLFFKSKTKLCHYHNTHKQIHAQVRQLP